MTKENIKIEPNKITIKYQKPMLTQLLGVIFLIISVYFYDKVRHLSYQVNTLENYIQFNTANILLIVLYILFGLMLLYWGIILTVRRYSLIIDGSSHKLDEIFSYGPIKRCYSLPSYKLSEILLAPRIKLPDDYEGEGELVKRNFYLKINKRDTKKNWILIQTPYSLDNTRDLALKISKMLDIPLNDQTIKNEIRKTTLEIKPISQGSIVMRKLEFRDLSHFFYLVIEAKEDSLLLQELGQTEVNRPASAGIDGWRRPIIPNEGDFKNLPDEQKIVYKKDGRFIDNIGCIYEPWDGQDKPYRYV